jgi:hypothetical protein
LRIVHRHRPSAPIRQLGGMLIHTGVRRRRILHLAATGYARHL